MTMENAPPRWPLKREPTPADRTFPGYAAASTEAQLTAEGLWRFTDAHGRREVHPAVIATELYSAGYLWATDLHDATERVVLHVLQLEESGFLSTYVAEGREWLALHRPLPAPVAFAPPPPPPSTPGITRDDSTALKREKEREETRERARAHAQAIEDAQARIWAQARTPRPHAGPREIPLEMLAPPIGCNDHPNGVLGEECGPCGTATSQRKLWFARQRFEKQLADDEFWGGGQPDDEPF